MYFLAFCFFILCSLATTYKLPQSITPNVLDYPLNNDDLGRVFFRDGLEREANENEIDDEDFDTDMRVSEDLGPQIVDIPLGTPDEVKF